MIAGKRVSNSAEGAAEIINEEADLSKEELSPVDLSGEWRDELLDQEGWHKVLQTFAETMRLAVALTDAEGRVLGQCHNPQPTWRLARGVSPAMEGECPFCLAPPASCSAVADALRTHRVVTVEDPAGLAHVAVPLFLGGQQMGALIAGQVFCRYPEPLPLQRVARDLGISRQELWELAIRQVPIARRTLELYADLLKSLGQAVLGERHAAVLQRKLAQTSQRYRLFFDGVKDYALFTLDHAGIVTTWNSGAERMFGYRAAEIVGRHSSCLVVPEEGHREALEQAMLDAGQSGWVEREVWRLRKDGTRFLGAGVLAAIRSGNTREYGSLVRDVTALRRSEKELQQAQKMEGIGVLAGGIAHDFNNLLTGITASLSIVKSTLPVDDPSYPMVELAEESSERAAELVAQLLAYAGKGKFVVTRFELSALISAMLPLIAASIPKTVKLDLLFTPELPWIHADASQIRQIVMNLIINGAESIGPEGGVVRVLTGVTGDGKNVFMEVKDSGSGMSDATKARIFDPFFTTKFVGRGLGLAAVSGIIRSHQGTMHVDSVPGRGTTFTVSFPAVPPDRLSRTDLSCTVPPPLVIARGTGTILVVDDEPALRNLAGIILKSAGYSVLFAKDGREAVESFRKNAATIAGVLLDMTMPVMGGRDAFQLIREIRPGVPIIISSGYSEMVAREEMGSDVVAGFMQKPYIASKLVQSVQETLRRAEHKAQGGNAAGKI